MVKKMVNKKVFAIFILSMFFISFISATTLDNFGTFKQGENIRVKQICEDSTYINLSSITYPNSSIAVSNIEMTSSGSGEFYYDFNLTNDLGRYDVSGISDGCLKTFTYYFDVNTNGTPQTTGHSLVYISIAIFFILVMVGFHKITKDFNYERWYKKMQEEYTTRNFVKFSLAAILYNIMKNSFIIYFLLGLPIVVVIMDLVNSYNLSSITIYMQSFLYIYMILVTILGIVFLSFVQEWFMDFVKDIQEINWGVGE